MSVYRGRDGGIVTVDSKPLDARLDLYNHSPTGFNWGYGGSGPAQLALAILAHHLNDDDQAVLFYQDFKWNVIAHLPQQDAWILTTEDIQGYFDGIRPI